MPPIDGFVINRTYFEFNDYRFPACVFVYFRYPLVVPIIFLNNFSSVLPGEFEGIFRSICLKKSSQAETNWEWTF